MPLRFSSSTTGRTPSFVELVRALGVLNARKSGANNGNRYASDPYGGRARQEEGSMNADHGRHLQG